MTLCVDMPRLQADIEALAGIGRGEKQGIYRMAFTDGDMAGREWLAGRLGDAGFESHQDGAANMGARLGGDGPCVMTGSHIDTVPAAGYLDGALGVVCGLEALRVLKEQDIALGHPVELVAFTDEEGRFGGMFGSQAMSGKLTPGAINEALASNGQSITEAMAARGLNALDALRAQRDPGAIHAFVELHIEQGPVLDHQARPIGLVEAITGLFRWEVSLIGAANHAGTTPMDMRQDAFQGLAEFAAAIDRVLEEHGSPCSRATVGRVQLLPGAANVVPGEAKFTLEVRDTDSGVLAELGDAFQRTLFAISRRRDLKFTHEISSRIEPVACSSLVMDAVRAASQDFDIEPLPMPSGAAHDTQMIASIAPAGMIFVPSRAGRSHSPEEWTSWAHIEIGANVLLNTLLRLAR